eukprot:8788828-Heterocapsa_arctica.AAC.1
MDLFRDGEDVTIRRTVELFVEQEGTRTCLARAHAAKLRFEGAGQCRSAPEEIEEFFAMDENNTV